MLAQVKVRFELNLSTTHGSIVAQQQLTAGCILFPLTCSLDVTFKVNKPLHSHLW